MATWDIDQGLKLPGAESDAGASDPLAAIRAINSMASPEGTAILVLQNFHRLAEANGRSRRQPACANCFPQPGGPTAGHATSKTCLFVGNLASTFER
jgi:hypothetical protein